MSPISELLALRIENAALKIQHLSALQAAYVEEARVEVGAPPDHVYDVRTRAFQPPDPS